MDKLLIVLLPALVAVVGVTGITGILYNKFNKSGKKFNWQGAFLAPWHYAQHGRWGLGLLFGFLYMIPLLGMIVAIYTGIRADTDLPKEKSNNAMLYVILISLWMVFIVYAQVRP